MTDISAIGPKELTRLLIAATPVLKAAVRGPLKRCTAILDQLAVRFGT